jgi:hypothetical protein
MVPIPTPISVPRICFVDLRLGALADDIRSTHVSDLPYDRMDHLRDCLGELDSQQKQTKTVDRLAPSHFPYRCVEGGFFVADHTGQLRFPFPSQDELDRDHHEWWRSATNI